MPFNSTGEKSFLAESAISASRAVEIVASGTIQHVVTAGNYGIGIATADIAAAQYGNIRLWNAGGTFEIAVSGTAVTPANTYQIIAGGYAGATTGTGSLTATQTGVASNGIVLEFIK